MAGTASNTARQHRAKSVAVICAAISLLQGCFQTPFSTNAAVSAIEGGASSVLVTTDETGRATGSFDPSAVYDQMLAATAGEISGTSAVFPPGALSIATDIAIESGASLTDGSAMADLGLTVNNAVASAGAAVIIRPAENVQLKQPMALSVPLPSGYGLSGLALADDNRLAILAKVFDTDGQLKSQLIPRSSLTVADGKATFQTMAFGAFQTVVLEQPVTEAKTAVTTEPIVNKTGVAVITSGGVVSQSAIAATESLSPLTFKRFVPTFTAATRRVTVTVEFSESTPQVNGCRGQIRDATKPTNVLFSGEKKGNVFENGTEGVEGPVLPGTVFGALEMQVVCEAKDGRVARSSWTSLGTVPRPDLTFVRFEPAFSQSTRVIKITGELSETSTAISACTVKFRNPSQPSTVVYQFTKTAGTAQNATPETLPYNMAGVLEASSTCTSTDGRSATSAWVAIGTVLPGVNGILTADQITATGARLTWTIPQDASPTTMYRVERAPGPSDFDNANTAAITTIQDWTEPSETGTTSQQLSVTGLTSGTTYAFRVGAKDDAGEILYYRVLVLSAGSGGAGGTSGGTAGGGTGGSDFIPPTIGQYAVAAQLSPGRIMLQTGWAYDNVTAQYNLQYKVAYSDAPFTNAAQFNSSAQLVTVRDWALNPGNAIELTQVNAAQANFKYYTVGVRDQAGNVALHPSVYLKIPGSDLASVNFWAYPAYVRDRIPFLEANIQNSSQAATTLQYSITIGTKPGLSDILAPGGDNSIDGTISVGQSGNSRITRDAQITGTTLTPRTFYYANLTFTNASGATVAKLQAPIYVTRPPVFYEFENTAANTGETATSAATAPYPGSTPAGFVFNDSNRINGSYAASFNGSHVITVPTLTVSSLASAGAGPVSATSSAPLNGFTVGGWVYQTSTPVANGALFGFDNFVEIGHGTGGKLAAFVKGLSAAMVTNVTLPVNQWNHVAVSGWAAGTSNPGQVAFFLNGVQIAQQSVPAGTTRFDQGSATTDFFKIGGNVWSSSDVKFAGQMDDVFASPWSFSERMIGQLASSLNCAFDEVMTGIDVHAGAIVDQFAPRCNKSWDLNPDTSVRGPVVGGSGGNPASFNCGFGEAVSGLEVVVGANSSFPADALNLVKATCVNTSTGASGSVSDSFGGSSGQSIAYTCPSGTLARGVRVRLDATGNFAGRVFGLNCK